MYPAPPPSRLPGLLAGTFKLLSWITGGSTALFFIYYVRRCDPLYISLIVMSPQRFVLPRLTQSALARRSLKTHQSDLLAKLTDSLREFKDEQKVAYADLPRPDPWEEPVEPWGECKSLGDVVTAAQAENRSPVVVPHVTLLRCALADLVGQNKPSTADEIFQALFSTELPSLLNIDDAYQVCRQYCVLCGYPRNNLFFNLRTRCGKRLTTRRFSIPQSLALPRSYLGGPIMSQNLCHSRRPHSCPPSPNCRVLSRVRCLSVPRSLSERRWRHLSTLLGT